METRTQAVFGNSIDTPTLLISGLSLNRKPQRKSLLSKLNGDFNASHFWNMNSDHESFTELSYARTLVVSLNRMETSTRVEEGTTKLKTVSTQVVSGATSCVQASTQDVVETCLQASTQVVYQDYTIL